MQWYWVHHIWRPFFLVPIVGGFIMDTSAYCNAISQHLVHSDFCGPMTTWSRGGATCLLTIFNEASTHKSTRYFTLLLIDSSTNESQSITVNLYFPHYDVSLYWMYHVPYSISVSSTSGIDWATLCTFSWSTCYNGSLFMMLAYFGCSTLGHFQQPILLTLT